MVTKIPLIDLETFVFQKWKLSNISVVQHGANTVKGGGVTLTDYVSILL
jgi:hypothetical protein